MSWCLLKIDKKDLIEMVRVGEIVSDFFRLRVNQNIAKKDIAGLRVFGFLGIV